VFIGRKTELAVLEKRYVSGKFELCVMYGRRRVGKTTLINEFVRDRDAVFFTAMETSAEENLVSLSRSIFSDNDGSLKPPVFRSFHDALEKIFASAAKKRLVFVIDEYPYLAVSYPGISSVLQKLIDENKDRSKLFIIINGSSMAMMENYFFTYKMPLYGRKTFQLKIEPFGFFEMKDYFSKTGAEILPYIYGVYGGIPKYFEYYDEKLSFRNNLLKNYLEQGAPLLDEPDSILKQEVRDPSNYNAILTAIAGGNTRYSDISDKAKLESGNITGFMKNLLALNLIRKESPVPEGSGRRSLYVLNDNMLRFWYRFIPAYISFINNNKGDLIRGIIEADLDTYMGRIFEDIVKEYLWRVNGTDVLPFTFTQAGRWWGNDSGKRQEAEIDLVAHDGKKNIIFCECKWRRQKTTPAVLADLKEKSEIPLFGKYGNKYLFVFSRGGFTEACRKTALEAGNVRLVEYRQMLAGTQAVLGNAGRR
jgi:AAA+ ATPase superfamily predicted ATPase